MASVIGRLALSNIRKRKSAAATLFILVALTVLLLTVGLSVSFKLGSFQEEKTAELHTPDLLAYYSDSSHAEAYKALVEADPATIYLEEENALLLQESKVKYGESDVLAGLLILHAQNPRELSPLPEKAVNPQSGRPDAVYLPLMFHLSGGYDVGDSFSFSEGSRVFSFPIGGFFEDVLLGTFNMGAVKLFANDSAFEHLEKELGQKARYHLLSATVQDSVKAEQLGQRLSEQISTWDSRSNFAVIDAQTGMEGNKFYVNLLSAILVVFSLLMVIIALIVIRFQIVAQIEDFIVNIGVLKANGYTSRQIRGAMLLQFFAVSLAAGLPGLAAAGALMPFAGNLISSSMGLLWPSAFDLAAALISLAAVALLVLTVAFRASRLVRLITPINALQKGLSNHNFRTNRLPLAGSRLGLQLVLGLKALFQQTRQNVMLLVIVAGLTFSSVFCIIMGFNMSGDNTEFIRLVGVEHSSISLTLKEGRISPEQIADLSAMEGVRKLTMLDQMVASIQGNVLLLQVSDDFGKLETQTVFRGRNPLNDNEISLSGIVAERAGKSVGDEIAVAVNGISQNYIITGLSQQITQLGMVASMTDEGFRRLVPDYTRQSVNLYLNDGAEIAAFMQNVEDRFPGTWDILNVEERLQGLLKTFAAAMTALTWIIASATILVVSLILYLVIKTLILKRKHEFGVLKGLGFTSLQLMTQITFSLLPVIVTGVLAGSVLGYFYSDQLFVLLLSGLGIYNVEASVSLPQVLILCLAVVAAAYAVSILVSRRIRRISVYGLISE
ncbi:ABC transporter permease [Paenibacillus sp. S150]|uniref:ABC transporter permease n=1 Tax=Paenibacillus sp. S150 TaxID=2749826 RepID=UPI001C5615BB|nr:ABC transporter permease [Paenibacillus sp. S150]MBW4080705.1 ABC transporter permease [Paenibacillus sp. S150]